MQSLVAFIEVWVGIPGRLIFFHVILGGDCYPGARGVDPVNIAKVKV